MADKKSGKDKAEAAKDKFKGRTKESAGSMTGDEKKKAEGRSDQDKGTAKKKKGQAKDLFS